MVGGVAMLDILVLLFVDETVRPETAAEEGSYLRLIDLFCSRGTPPRGSLYQTQLHAHQFVGRPGIVGVVVGVDQRTDEHLIVLNLI